MISRIGTHASKEYAYITTPYDNENVVSTVGEAIAESYITAPGEAIAESYITAPGETIADSYITAPGEAIADSYITVPGETIADSYITAPGETMIPDSYITAPGDLTLDYDNVVHGRVYYQNDVMNRKRVHIAVKSKPGNVVM